MRWLFALFALGGCDSIFRLDHINLDGPPLEDAPLADASCGRIGAGFIQLCVGGPDVTLAGTVSTDNNCQVTRFGASTFCLVAGDNVMVGDVTALGTFPLVVAARHTLTVAGFLDASSNVSGTPGAGARACGTPAGIPLSTGASGGPGGSFETEGGRGGSNAANGSVGPLMAGVAVAVLQGGCEGGPGGTAGATGGQGGQGGGAIYLLAGDAIVIAANAKISTAGQGGEGGHTTATLGTGGGGGGGGTGGMVVLDAPTVTLATMSEIWANGGGGGGGAAKSSIGGNGVVSPSPNAHGFGGLPNGGRGATGNSTGDDGGAYVMAGSNQICFAPQAAVAVAWAGFFTTVRRWRPPQRSRRRPSQVPSRGISRSRSDVISDRDG